MPDKDSQAFKYIELMVSILTQFAIAGNPNVPELGVEWPSAKMDVPLFGVNINEKKHELMTLPEMFRMGQLDKIYIEQGKKLY